MGARGRCDPGVVAPTTPGADRLVRATVRVPHDEFLGVWRAALAREAAPDGVTDWYPGAVAQTCRWLAAVPMRTALCGGLPRSPVTQRSCVAREELVEAEWLAAQQDRFSPDLAARSGWREGVRATLRWAWHREGPPPIDVPR